MSLELSYSNMSPLIGFPIWANPDIRRQSIVTTFGRTLPVDICYLPKGKAITRWKLPFRALDSTGNDSDASSCTVQGPRCIKLTHHERVGLQMVEIDVHGV